MKISFIYLSIIIVIFSISSSFAQYTTNIASGRPGNANGAGTVGKGILQFQVGIQYSELKSELDTGKFFSDISENLVIRYGLSERFEVSTVLNHSNQSYFTTEEKNQFSGFNTSMVRVRYRPLNNLAIQLGLNLPVLGNDFNRSYASPQIKVMYNTAFSEYLSLTTNLGAQWGDPSDDPNGFYVLSFSASLPAQFSLILEAYGDFNIYGLRNYYDAGLGYLINSDLLLDLNAGWGQNFGVESFFITTGVSYRIKTAFRD